MRMGCAYVVSTGVVLGGAVDAYGVLVALKAVKKNNAPIAQTSEIVAAPGDTIEAEFLISDWAAEYPDGLRIYNILLKGRKAVDSGTNGFVLPKGWDAPLDTTYCGANADCSFDPSFVCVAGLCRSPAFNPMLGAFISQLRPDFLFADGGAVFGVGTSSLDFVYFGIREKGGVLDPGHPLYAGTLVLVVGESACGTFRFAFDVCGGTVVQSPSYETITPSVIPLVIQLPECPAIPINSEPANCLEDARIPHTRNQPLSLLTADSLFVEFDDSPANLTTASFRTRIVPAGTAPAVDGIHFLPADSVQLDLSKAIPAGAWTCIEHRASGREICLGSLPADVNGDGVVDSDDIQDFRERPFLPDDDPNYEPAPPNGPTDDLLEWMDTRLVRDLTRCDIDRSGQCTPTDIIMAMNLMLGSGFAVWNGAELSLCPSQQAIDPRLPTGACCNTRFGSCVNDVREANCQGVDDVWANDTPCCENSCSAPTGACCELSTGDCRNGELEVNCQGIQQVWTKGAACGAVSCGAARGACCNLDSGACGNTLLESQCQHSSDIWFPGSSCNQILCSPQ